MNFTKKIKASAVVASILAASATAPMAFAEVSASVGVASTYLWRGADLGSGTPAVFGDLNYSAGGAYAGIWGSSGDEASGTEYDLYVGYGGSVGEFSYDLSLWNYVYPTGAYENDFFDIADLVVSLGFGPAAFTAYVPVGDNSSGDYMYYTLSATAGKYSATLGMHADNAADGGAVACPLDTAAGDSCDPIHLNLSYAYNDNLAFTFSQFIADETDTDDLKFVVSYSMPIGE